MHLKYPSHFPNRYYKYCNGWNLIRLIDAMFQLAPGESVNLHSKNDLNTVLHRLQGLEKT